MEFREESATSVGNNDGEIYERLQVNGGYDGSDELDDEVGYSFEGTNTNRFEDLAELSGGDVDPQPQSDLFTITLSPMEIRTFVISLEWRP